MRAAPGKLRPAGGPPTGGSRAPQGSTLPLLPGGGRGRGGFQRTPGPREPGGTPGRPPHPRGRAKGRGRLQIVSAGGGRDPASWGPERGEGVPQPLKNGVRHAKRVTLGSSGAPEAGRQGWAGPLARRKEMEAWGVGSEVRASPGAWPVRRWPEPRSPDLDLQKGKLSLAALPPQTGGRERYLDAVT